MVTTTVYWRAPLVLLLVAAGTVFAVSEWRLIAWQGLLPLFEWMETTLFGRIGKTWGAAFALVEAFHLLGMAALGGALILCDARLLGIAFREQPVAEVWRQTLRVFVPALIVVLATGVFMACSVAMKIYYLEVFWYKMLALAVGVLFVFFIKRPVVASEAAPPGPLLSRLLAVASLMVWFSVAATGRWIGFSG
jgi:hypothetical protein